MRAILFTILFYISFSNCNNNKGGNSYSNRLPYFRRKVEEVLDDWLAPTPSPTEDSQSHLVSFLIENVKEIFKDTYDSAVADIEDNGVQEKEVDAEDIGILQSSNKHKLGFRLTTPLRVTRFTEKAIPAQLEITKFIPVRSTPANSDLAYVAFTPLRIHNYAKGFQKNTYENANSNFTMNFWLSTTGFHLPEIHTKVPYFNIKYDDYEITKTNGQATDSNLQNSSELKKSDDVMMLYDLFASATHTPKLTDHLTTKKTGDVMMYENLPLQPMELPLNKKTYETRENGNVEGNTKDGLNIHNMETKNESVEDGIIRSEVFNHEDNKINEEKVYIQSTKSQKVDMVTSENDNISEDTTVPENISTKEETALTEQNIFPDATVYPVSKPYSHYLKLNENVSDEEDTEIEVSKRIQSRVYNKTLLAPLEIGADSGDNAKRTCIVCDNVAVSECSSPKNKKIPSIDCSQKEDFCYSVHTPFGIVHRGCFNVNRNMTTYVCSCNLCNYMPVTDLPVMFFTKRAWISNVYDLSHAKRLRKSTAKDMKCLRCEVNVTASGNSTESNLCLSGQISKLPKEICTQDQICGIKTIKSQGYVWRGCISTPLYNYYMTLCDSNLCNFDPIVSVFDTD